MNAVGIDVSKGKSTVAIMRPFGEVIAEPFEVSHTDTELRKLACFLGQHRTIAEASAVESPIRQETIGFPAHFFARAHNFKPPGRACQPEADSPMRT